MHDLSFYFNDEDLPSVRLRFLDFDQWSRPVALSRLHNYSLEVRGQSESIRSTKVHPQVRRTLGPMDSGRTQDSVQLNAFVRPRLNVRGVWIR